MSAVRTGRARPTSRLVVGSLGALAVAIATVGAAHAAAGAATTLIHAAPDGSGAACTVAAPCALSEAQDVARSAARHMAGDVDVRLAGGTYRLSAPLAFTPADSGRDGHVVSYQAEPGATPVLSGARQITGWSRADAATNLWSAPVPASLDTRQLYVDGARAQVAQATSPVRLTRTADDTGFTAADDSMAAWRNPSDIEFVFTGEAGAWEETRCRVASIHGETVTMRQPCWDNSIYHSTHLSGHPSGTFSPLPSNAVPTLVENAFELLTTPGQWYLDATAHRLYYMPLPGQSMASADVEAPVLQTLVRGDGTPSAPVADLSFSGITFAYQTWLAPSGDDGYSDMQSGHTLTGTDAWERQGVCEYSDPRGSCPYAAWTQQPAAVSLTGADHVTFQGDTFTHLGAAGLYLGDGARHDVVEGDDFTDISGSGIEIGNVTDPLPADVHAGEDEITEDDTVADNWIHGIGVEYHDGTGVYVGYARGVTVTHNQLDDLSWDGIDIGFGGWTTNSYYPFAETNVNQDNVVSDNLIYDFHQVLSDGGGIYSNGRQGTGWSHGLTETGNVVYGMVNGGQVYYTDQGSAWVTIKGNADWNVNGPSFGGCAPLGHLRFDDNYYTTSFDPTASGCAPAPVDVSATGDQQISGLTPTPGSVPDSLLAGAGPRAAYRSPLAAAGPSVTGFSGQDTITSAVTRVLVTGSGFTPESTVDFGTGTGAAASATAATAVDVLSPGFLVATVPAGVLLDRVTVTTAAGSVATPSVFPSLAASFDNVGITDDATPGDADIDGSGYGYSAEALAAAGAHSGASLAYHGLAFTWPVESAGRPDDTTANGQIISASGTGDTLGFLFTGITNSPPESGTGVIVYTDGSTQSYTLTSPNWYGNPPAGSDGALVTPYRDSANGADHDPVTIYYQGVPLRSGEHVADVVLPAGSGQANPAVHVFAMTIGTATS